MKNNFETNIVYKLNGKYITLKMPISKRTLVLVNNRLLELYWSNSLPTNFAPNMQNSFSGFKTPDEMTEVNAQALLNVMNRIL